MLPPSLKKGIIVVLSIDSIRYRSLVFGCREMTAMQWSYLSDCLYQSEVSMDNRETSVQSKYSIYFLQYDSLVFKK